MDIKSDLSSYKIAETTIGNHEGQKDENLETNYVEEADTENDLFTETIIINEEGQIVAKFKVENITDTENVTGTETIIEAKEFQVDKKKMKETNTKSVKVTEKIKK
ncbi:hypothetical protein O0L34_g9239 [Tuta absoluta]|nr:hypothetical protein O0L34_g9239 [Tuta absoluta]